MAKHSETARRPEHRAQELSTPAAVLSSEELSRDDKIALLRQWELDLREGMVADEENMPAAEPGPVNLDDVLDALRRLGAETEFRDVPTKHG